MATLNGLKTTKRMAKSHAGIDAKKLHSLEEAVRLVKARASTKFDETVEIALNLGVDPKYPDQQVRGVCSLPHGTGKTLRVAVFAKDKKAEEARAAGADIVGDQDLFETINGGKIDFDRLIATPDMMTLVGRLGKILGPRGLMPNPKVGTVTPDVAKAVKDSKGGAVEFRAEKAGIIHAGVGKVSFSEEQLVGNARAFIEAVVRARPSGAKGTFVRKMAMSSTMGPGVRIDASGYSTVSGAN